MNGNYWIVDTGAFNHVTSPMVAINKFQPSDKNLKVLMVDGVVFDYGTRDSLCLVCN